MFTLLLIIGALAASAGLYTLFSDSSKTVPETTSPESQTKKPDESLKFERGKEFRISSASPAETVQPVTQALPKTIPLQELTKKIKEGNLRSKKKLKLTYDTDDIINKNSRYSFHRRPLLNSETLVEKENYNGALEILGRTEARIPDEEIKSKINKNIDDIKKFLSGDEEDDLFSPEDEKYSKVEVPFSDLVHAIKEISEGLAGTLNRGFSIPISMPTMQGAVPSPSYSPQTESGKSSQQGAQSQSPQKESGKSAQSGVKGTAATADFSGGGGEFRVVGVPVIIDPSAFGGILPPPESKDMKLPSREIPSYSGMPPVIYQFFQGSPGGGPGLAPPPPELFSPGSPSAPGNGPSQFPKSPLEKDQEKKLSDFLDKPDSGIESADNVPDIGSLDNFYFDDEWDKFKDLPIKDRRSGKERRQGSDRRNEFLRKDRRSGEDRRKTDLFREREQYLKQKEDQKKEDNLKKLFDNKKLSEIVPQFGGGGQPFFPELIPILLPDPFDAETYTKSLPLPHGVEQENLVGYFALPSPEEHRLHHGNEETFHDSIPTEVEDYQPKSVTLPEIKLPDPVDDRFQELPPPTVAHEQTQTIREIIKEVESASPETAQSPVTPLEKISLPDPWDMLRDREKEEVEASPLPQLPPAGPSDEDFPEIEVLDGNLDEIDSDKEAEQPPEKEPERTIHGILELKPPEADDAPFLTLTYDFSKIPHSYKLSKNYSIMEYSYYKYKPMLMKAQEFARRKMLKNALNYYRVIKSQNIPPELKRMVNRNITDITEFLEKYLMAKGG